MTVSSTESQIIVGGDGATRVFDFGFVGVSASDITVIFTDTTGTQTTLLPSQYLISLNPAEAGSLWGLGGTCTYPLSGSAIAAGTTLTIQRGLPLQQNTSISGQGAFNPEVVEQALDLLEMQLQQVASRTIQYRGTWIPGEVYNVGDIVVDGPNSNNTGSLFLCINSNTSATWTADLAAGDWSLILQAGSLSVPLPLSIGNGGTGQATAAAALAALGGIALGANNAFTGANSFTGGSITVPTRSPGDSTTNAASTSFATSAVAAKAPIANPAFTGTATAVLFSGPTAGVTNGSSAASGQVGEFLSNTATQGSVSMTSTSPATVTSISLTPGDWDVSGNVRFSPAGGTTPTQTLVGLNTTTNTFVGGSDAALTALNASTITGADVVIGTPQFRVSLTSTTTYYLIAQSTFSGGTLGTGGSIRARRVR